MTRRLGSGWLLPVAAAATLAAPPGAAAQTPRILWSGPVDPAWSTAEELVLHGTLQDGVFVPQGLALPEREAPGVPPLLPLVGDILPTLRARAFGVEERAGLIVGERSVRLLCSAGQRPAGIVIDAPGRHFPRGMRGYLLASGQARGGTVGLSLVRPGGDAPEPPQTLFRDGKATVPLVQDASTLVVTCPSEAAELTIERVQLVPDGRAAARRGSWIWDAANAIRDPSAFAADIAAAGLDEIAIQAPAAPSALASVARALAASGIAWYLVEGDPDMIKPGGLARSLARIRLLRRMRQGLPGRDAPVRLELDIEPHGLADYALDPRAAWRDWAVAVNAIARAWGHPVDIVVPWWMEIAPGGTAALAAVHGSIGTVVVMAYRTEPQLILEAAEPWLAKGLPVKVAIESGSVAPEVQRSYRRASAGTLVVTEDRAVLNDVPVARAAGAETFLLTGEIRTRSERVSFHKRDDERRAAERAILPFLGGWVNFAGLRVHGLLAGKDP